MFMSSDFHNDLSLNLITLIKFKAIFNTAVRIGHRLISVAKLLRFGLRLIDLSKNYNKIIMLFHLHSIRHFQ